MDLVFKRLVRLSVACMYVIERYFMSQQFFALIHNEQVHFVNVKAAQSRALSCDHQHGGGYRWVEEPLRMTERTRQPDV